MALEKDASVFNDEENQDEVLYKTLRVINKPYKKTYVPGINIKGKYLSAYGFNLGDEVKVLVSENQISISKFECA